MKNRTSLLFGVVTIALIALAQFVKAQPVTDGLVAYYPFTGNAHDVSVNEWHADVTGATLTTDMGSQADGAYAFDGDDYMTSFLQVDTSAGTVAAWVYVDSYQTGFNQLNLVLGQSDNLQLGLGDTSVGGDGHWVFRYHPAGSWANLIGPEATLGEWIHVAGVWDGMGIVLYLDGDVEATSPAGPLRAASGTLNIGRHPANQNFWFGMIDEVLVYDRALSPGEIALLAVDPTPADNRTWSEVKTSFR